MRRKLIAGNWKMNTTLADAHILANGVRTHAEDFNNIEVVLFPPLLWLTELSHQVIGRKEFAHLSLGAQNIHFEEKGAYTGETSPTMVKEVAEFALIGHSERVKYFDEGPEMLSKKIQAAFDAGLKPVLCIGELEKGTGAQRQLVHLLNHIVKGLPENELDKLIVAYEPVWAIGTGNPATSEYAQEVAMTLRGSLTPKNQILYGGSVDENNAKEFLLQPDIDGLLIGGTSLKLKPFLTVCQVAQDLSSVGRNK